MRNIFSGSHGRIIGAPLSLMAPEVAAAMAAVATGRFDNGGSRSVRTRPRPRPASESRALSTKDAKSILNRLEHRRTLAAMDRMAADAQPRSLTLAQAKRILSSVEAHNRRHGIEPHQQRKIVVHIPRARSRR
jgi:hypothetical protein